VNKSDVQETLALLYLRLNGYFASGFIVQASHRNKTEMDVLAVRFPRHCEPEREVQCCPRLAVPSARIDFIVGEVKGGKRNANFNPRFREDPDAIRAVLNRFGAFADGEIEFVCKCIPEVLDPGKMRNAVSIPALPVCGGTAQLRFVVFTPEQEKKDGETRPYIFEADLINYVWECFRPDQLRPRCDTTYNYELWGPQFVTMVQYFKNPNKTTPGTINDLYAALNAAAPIPSARRIAATNDELIVDLSDGRTLSVPLAWFPRLLHGSGAERANWTPIGDGEGIHWPDLDEDLSVEGLLAGRASGESQASLQRWLDGRRAPTGPK
jgi:hypothetical protein